MRPQSIIWFERAYLLSFVLGLISTAQTWAMRQDILARKLGSYDLAWLAPTTSALGVVIALALWYLVAHRASGAAKWIVTVFAAWGAILLTIIVFGLINEQGEPGVLLVGAAQNILYIAATAMLFREDAVAWFGKSAGEPA